MPTSCIGTVNSLTPGKMFCHCCKVLSQNTMTEDEIIHYRNGLVLPVDIKLSTELSVCCAVLLSALQHGCETETEQICATPEGLISSRCATFAISAGQNVKARVPEPKSLEVIKCLGVTACL